MIRLRFFLILCFMLTACAPTLKMEQHKSLVNQVAEDELPTTVAILPFVNETAEPGVDILVRRTFANHFTAKNYRDLKLPVVDEKLVRFEKSSGTTAATAKPAELAAALGADGILYGKVTDWKWLYTGVYSQLGVACEIWMVNAKSGKELLRIRDEVRYHEGGIPLSPLSAIVTVVSTAMNLRDIQKVRMVNELSYKLLEKVPAPKNLTATEPRPIIREVLTNALEGPLTVRKQLKVGLQGDPGLVASYDIGNFKKGLAMKEVQPGIYSGEYAVFPGDTARDMPVVVTLSRPGGFESQWIDVSGYVNIDTTPPPSVAGLRAKGYADRVELAWQGVANTPDLKGYRLLRSESPLSGYQEVATVEETIWTDHSAQAGKGYYYRVIPFDMAGNEAEPGDPVRAVLTAAEPQPLAGTIAGDRTLEGSYVVTDSLIIPRGVTVTLAPEARLFIAAGKGITVQGKMLSAKGEGGVEFLPSGEGRWLGILADGGQLELERFKLWGAETGVVLQNAEGRLLAGAVTDCGVGIQVVGTGAVDLREMTVSGNKTGLKLVRSTATVKGNTIVQNDKGVDLDTYSGQLEGNNIFDNKMNVAATSTQKIGVNYLGALHVDELRLEMVTVEKTYDAKLPGGKEVTPQDSPYRKLTAEERQRKQAEILVEAGDYFRKRNFGKAAVLFEESLKVAPSADVYYYLALSNQEMKEGEKALYILQEGVALFPMEANLWKSLGVLSYERGDNETARKALDKALRLSPDDRQARFIREKLGEGKK